MDAIVKLAAKIKGVSYEEFLEHKEEDEYKEALQKAKLINTEVPGGIGYGLKRYWETKIDLSRCDSIKKSLT